MCIVVPLSGPVRTTVIAREKCTFDIVQKPLSSTIYELLRFYPLSCDGRGIVDLVGLFLLYESYLI